MLIKSLYNTTKQQIDARHWNPYLGISINNRAFTNDYLFAYMDWASQRAKKGAAIVIVDIIQHINNRILDRSKPISAIEKAFRKADEIHHLCHQAKSRLSHEARNRVIIIEWTDILYDATFQHNLSIMQEEYVQNQQFRDALLSITKRNLGSIVSRLDERQVETITQYLVNELPELITGFVHDGIHYNLNVYPGKIGSIYTELTRFDFFRQIHSRLRIIGEIASAEAYLPTGEDGLRL